MQMPACVYRWYFHPHPEKNTLSLSGIRPIRESFIGLVEAPETLSAIDISSDTASEKSRRRQRAVANGCKDGCELSGTIGKSWRDSAINGEQAPTVSENYRALDDSLESLLVCR
jgi:hypothetical protein